MSIKAKSLTVKVGEKTLLENLSIEANDGEIIAVLGPNGAGKSSLLKTLTGELKPSSGDIFFGEKSLNEWNASELAKIRGVLPQNFALDFPFKAVEVVLLGRTPHIRFSESKLDHEIAESALKMVEAEKFANRFYPTLSGGERQRVHLARVLAQIWQKTENSPRYLLLDEPTSSLDLAHQHLTLETARKFAADGTAVVAVLHDLNLAAQYADKILIIKEGKNIAFDTPKNVLTSDLIGEVFGIEVYITNHAKYSDIPLIVPVGKFLKSEQALSAKV